LARAAPPCSDFTIRRPISQYTAGHDGIDIPGSGRASCIEQLNDFGTDVVVVLLNGFIFVIAIAP